MRFFSKRGDARHGLDARRRADRSIRPSLSGLERRDLLAAGALGINAVPDYVDLMKSVRDWEPVPAWMDYYNSPDAITRDADGWPTTDAGLVVVDDRVNQWYNGPDPNAAKVNLSGTYHISFEGSAQIVSPDNIWSIQNQVYNASTNTTTADLNLTQVDDLAFFRLYFVSTKNPASPTGAGVADIKLIRPGYAAGPTQLFTNTLLDALKGFDTIRVVDAAATNDFTLAKDANGRLVPLEWSQRRLPTASSQLDNYRGQLGQSWEYLVQLANEANQNLWVNIPGHASDDYVRQLAALIKNGSTVGGVTYPGLKTGLKIYLEYSNETWGGMYNPYSYNMAATQQELASGSSALNNDGLTDAYQLAGRRYFQRSMQVSQIFRNAYGPDPNYDVVRPVLGWQSGMASYVHQTLTWLGSTYGAPRDYFYGIGAANYFEATDYSSVDQALETLRRNVDNITASIKSYALVARYHGLKNIAYEGSPALSGPAYTNQAAVALAASRDPRLTQIVVDAFKAFYAAGEDLVNFYRGPYGIWSPSQQWHAAELGQAGNPTASPKFAALRALQAASPVAVDIGRPISTVGPTDLPIQEDDLGTYNASYPTTGQTSLWLLKVQVAGTYKLELQTRDWGGSVAPAIIQVLLNDKTVLGTYSVSADSKFDLGTLTLPAGAITLGIRAVRARNDPSRPDNPNYYGFRMQSLTLSPVSVNAPISTPFSLQDAGFDTIWPGPYGYAYRPSGTPWTFAADAGLAASGGAITALSATPSGNQAAFLQNKGSFSQSVSGWAAGDYTISFAAARRSYNGNQDLRILVDGVEVGRFRPDSARYQTYTTSAFAVTAGAHTITFQGLNSAGGDNIALIDSIAIAAASSSPPSTPLTVADAGFEGTSPGPYGYAYRPSGTPWTFAADAGLATSGGAITALSATPSGNQAAFLQNKGSFSQSVSGWAAGSYTISFAAARRSYYGNQDFVVLVDGVEVGRFRPDSARYQTYATAPFTVTAGSHTITFQGLNSAGGDNTALIDSVAIAASSSSSSPPYTPDPTLTVADAGFDGTAPGPYGYAYRPTGTPWTFAAESGLAAAGGPITALSATPSGNQAAFLQNKGSVSQSVSGWAAGRYTISFAAARRSYYGNQDFVVLVDGVEVGRFRPDSARYQTYTTASFAVTAGSHTITFQGLNSAGGDNTALIDSIAIAVAT